MNSCLWSQASPLGPLTITAGPKGVRSVALGGAAPPHRCEACRGIQEAFDRYFVGDAQALAEVPVDLSLAATAFQRRVFETLRAAVPPGATTTYGTLAEAVGRPGAARAVGTALARNPAPIVVPCHRVLQSGGDLGGYGGGLAMKRYLLALEGAKITRGR